MMLKRCPWGAGALLKAQPFDPDAVPRPRATVTSGHCQPSWRGRSQHPHHIQSGNATTAPDKPRLQLGAAAECVLPGG